MTTNDDKKDKRRFEAVIMGVSYDDDRCLTYVRLEFDGGSAVFGGLHLPGDGDMTAFLEAVRRVVGIRPGRPLDGHRCWALRPRGDFGETIEGIESIDGARRMTLTGFARSRGYEVLSALERDRAVLESTIVNAERRIADARRELKTLDARTFDWGDGNVVGGSP